MLSEQPKRSGFIRGCSGHEQQGEDHRHAGHAEQLNLYTHTVIPPNPFTSKAKCYSPNFLFLKNIYSERGRNLRFNSCYR